MTDGKIKPTAQFSHLLRRVSEDVRTRSPGDTEVRGDRYVHGEATHQVGAAGQEAWESVVATSIKFWSTDPGPKMRRVVAAEVMQALDGLEGVIASGEAAALLEDHRRLQHGFEIVYDGTLPAEVKEFLAQLRSLIADSTRDFVGKLKDDLLQSKDSILRILDEDARAFAVIILDALGRHEPIDRQVLEAAIQHLRSTLTLADYRIEHAGELDLLAKRFEWLHAAVGIHSPVLESR